MNEMIMNNKKILLFHDVKACWTREVFDGCERFLQAAALLQTGEYLGFQFIAGREPVPLAGAFSSPNARITEKDYQWMFEGCATVKEPSATPQKEFEGDGQRIYVLQKDPSGRACGRVDKTDKGFGRRFECFLNALGEEEGSLRVVAMPGQEQERGLLYFGLPAVMSLRLESAIMLLFPGTEIRELQGSGEEIPENGRLPLSSLMDGMMGIMGLIKRKEEEYKAEETDWEEIPDDLLEELESDEALAGRAEDEGPCYREMLRNLVGLANVKEQVERIICFAKMKHDLMEQRVSCKNIALNMEFIGNPGTAKTTVARILAGLFFEIGLLEDPEIVEVGRADLIAGYVGQTAEKVKAVFEKARGKLLFIDEAYSLVEDGRNYCGEAISTIVQEMENHREETIVVFAGYPDSMKKFFEMNPGLRSRVPFQICFADYSVDEMLKITELEADRRGFRIQPNALAKVAALCGEVTYGSKAGNGRFCRNLVENAILGYATRTYGKDGEGKARDFVLTEQDFTPAGHLAGEKEIPKKIGF